LVTKRKIKSGEIITKDMLTFKRPATGISPKYIDDIIGMRVNDELDEDTILQWSFLRKNM